MKTPQAFSCRSDSWYAVHCKPRKEFYVATMLESQLGLPVFLPECTRRLRGEVRRIPFFPGYLFVRVNFRQVSLYCINTMSGVVRLVEFGGEPQPISSLVIEEISEEVKRVNMSKHLQQPKFSAGDKVRVKSGPLQNLEMMFVESSTPSKRVHVLLHVLGHLAKARVDIDTLEKISDK